MSDDWLFHEIRDGLAALFILRLPGAPAGDTLEAVIKTWTAALRMNRTFDRDRDAPRIRQAFLRLAANQTNWPAPRSLIDAMPAPPAQRRLAGPKGDPDAAERALAEISAMLGTVPRGNGQDGAVRAPERPYEPGYLQKVEADLKRQFDRKRAAGGDMDDDR